MIITILSVIFALLFLLKAFIHISYLHTRVYNIIEYHCDRVLFWLIMSFAVLILGAFIERVING